LTKPYPPTCTAAVFTQPNHPLELRNLPLPESLASGELLVKVTCCTVCGSDLHTHSGRRPGPTPCVLGHEIVGTVAAVGNDPPNDLRGERVEIGDRLIWSVAAACHRCRNCQRGIPQKCESLRKYGHHAIESTWQLSGGLAEYCHLVGGTDFAIIDDEIPNEIICPVSCATATVASAMRAAGDIHGSKVLVLGAGMLGLTATAMARSLGAESVSVCDVAQDRLQLAKRFGCHEPMQFGELAGEFDVVFEMSGNAAAMQAALQRAAVGGAILWVGAVMPSDPISVDPEQVVRRLLSVHGVHNYAPQDLLTAIDFLTDHGQEFPFSELVAQSYSLSQANKAIDYANAAKPIRIAVCP
jgi:putative phosphonate catabolism associated alcohol dehydrogenase